MNAYREDEATLSIIKNESTGIFAGAKAAYSASAKDKRGAVFTRDEVVDFVLRISGFYARNQILGCRTLEPSCGEGDFLLPVVDHLLEQVAASGSTELRNVEQIKGAILAVEVNEESFVSVRAAVDDRLVQNGYSKKSRNTLLNSWLLNDDFLLTPIEGQFDFVVGNPPYLRQESVPADLLREYKRRYKTIYDRADLYVPFIERGLNLLSADGCLAYICADRWVKNKYGGPLRRMVSESFSLVHYVDMFETDAFKSSVIAYPAITVIERGANDQGTTIVKRPKVDSETMTTLATQMLSGKQTPDVRKAYDVVAGDAPWLVDCPEQLRLVRSIESGFKTLEESGCKVGIGVATGADRIYIADNSSLDVEPSRKLPLLTTADIDTGGIAWKGKFVLNPFNEDGSLVELSKYPKLSAYLKLHEEGIRKRHVAKKFPDKWFRTIDRITPSIQTTPKLLIPDIKGGVLVALDEGEYYPHHNLYYITSQSWDLRALRAILLAGIGQLFVSTYSPRMRGGCFRFQAQYLRRICLPAWNKMPGQLQAGLVEAGESCDMERCLNLTSSAYGLSPNDLKTLSRCVPERSPHAT